MPNPPQEMKPIRVMMVEDNDGYRMGMSLVLERAEGVVLLRSCSNAEYAMRLLDQGDEAAPDVLLLDLRLPGMDGAEALYKIRERNREMKIIILTQSTARMDLLYCIHHGAAGYLLKSAGAGEIVEAIRVVHGGGVIIDPQVARHILDFMQTIPAGAVGATELLSEREIEVLTLLAEGLAKKEISERLQIAYTTVETHTKRIYEKLDAKNAPAAVSQAYRRGLL